MMTNNDLQSGEYRHRYGVGGEEGDETKHSIHAALHLKIIRMLINDINDVNQDKAYRLHEAKPSKHTGLHQQIYLTSLQASKLR